MSSGSSPGPTAGGATAGLGAACYHSTSCDEAHECGDITPNHVTFLRVEAGGGFSGHTTLGGDGRFDPWSGLPPRWLRLCQQHPVAETAKEVRVAVAAGVPLQPG
jgi:hypothetical protein